jgi:hypothetical protein
MSITSWLVIGIVCWLGGYLGTALTVSPDEEATVQVPGWLYLACGKPHASVLPERTLSGGGFTMQLTGWCLILYKLAVEYVFPQYPSLDRAVFGWVVSFGIGITTTLLIRHFYKP